MSINVGIDHLESLGVALETYTRLVEAIPDALPDATLVVDEQGRIVYANLAVEPTFGYSRDALLGQAIEVLMPERYREKHVAYRRGFFDMPRARPMGGTGVHLRALRRNGVEFPVSISLGPLYTPAGTFVVAVVRQKHAERRIGEILVAEGVCTEEQIAAALRKQAGQA